MTRCAVADVRVATEIQALGQRLSSWEPSLDLFCGEDECRVFEPDGTFYGINLSVETALTVRHKLNPLRRGDAFVVPQGVSIDVEPPFCFLAIRHVGTPPHHFRERFIQTWGLDVRPTPANISAKLPSEVLPEEPLRYRVRYQILGPGTFRRDFQTGFEVHLIVGLEGVTTLHAQGQSPLEIGPDILAWIPDGTPYTLVGDGRVGLLRLDTEVMYESRRLRALVELNSRVSPEFQPGVLPEPNN